MSGIGVKEGLEQKWLGKWGESHLTPDEAARIMAAVKDFGRDGLNTKVSPTSGRLRVDRKYVAAGLDTYNMIRLCASFPVSTYLADKLDFWASPTDAWEKEFVVRLTERLRLPVPEEDQVEYICLGSPSP